MLTKKYIIINTSTSQNNSKCKKQRPIILIKWRYDIIGKKPNNNCTHHFQNHSPCSWYFIGDCNSNRFVCCNWDLKNYEIFYVGIFFGLNIMLIFFYHNSTKGHSQCSWILLKLIKCIHNIFKMAISSIIKYWNRWIRYDSIHRYQQNRQGN